MYIFKHFQALLYLWLIVSVEAYSSQQKSKVKVIDGTYLIEQHPTTYEASWPLFFKVILPPLLTNSSKAYEECMLQTEATNNVTTPEKCEIIQIYKEIMDTLQELQAESNEDGNMGNSRQKRVKRQLLVAGAVLGGLLFGPVIKKTLKKLFGGDPEMQQFVTQLRNSVSDNHKDLLKIHEYEMEVDKAQEIRISNVERVLADKVDRLAVKVLLLWDRTTALAFKQEWETSIAQCLTGLIPSHLVPISLFRKKTNALNSRMKNDGFKLAIPPASFSSYYKIPIAECFLTSTSVFVIVNVPVVSIQSNWKLFEVVHAHFAFQGQTCQIYPAETSFIAQNSEQTVLINGHILQHCSISEHGICHIPMHNRESRESVNCAVGIIKQSSVQELKKTCVYQCSPNTQLRIQELNENKLLLTNADNVTIICGKSENVIHFERVGAVELTLGCDCNVYVNDDLQRRPFPCLGKNEGIASATVVLPLLMTKLPGTLSNQGQQYYSDADSILNRDWAQEMAIHNITTQSSLFLHGVKLSNFTLPEKLDVAVGDEWWSSNRNWLYILTAAVTILILERIFACCYARRGNVGPILPLLLSNNVQPVAAVTHKEEVVGVLLVLTLLFLLAIFIWIIRFCIPWYRRKTNGGKAVSIGRPEEFEMRTIKEVKNIGRQVAVPAGVYICQKRFDDFIPVIGTPLRTNSFVELAD